MKLAVMTLSLLRIIESSKTLDEIALDRYAISIAQAKLRTDVGIAYRLSTGRQALFSAVHGVK